MTGRTPAQTLSNLVQSIGILCVIATFALISPGVRIVRADSADSAESVESGNETNMSIDPVLEARRAKAPAPPVAPVVPAGDAAALERPGIAGVETEPGVIVLNTRGYNYGPRPGSLDPAAIAQEAQPR